jgi:hypothetical protein
MAKFYEEMTLEDFRQIADSLSDEWGSLGDGILIDYETGKHYQLPSEEAAMFLSSAHFMLKALLKRLPPYPALSGPSEDTP